MDPEFGLLLTATTLAVDAWTVEAVDALERSGVDVLLLKGPALARWLYADGELRPYGDADLMVAPDSLERAEAVLASIGYELKDPEGEKRLVSGPHAQEWRRGSDGAIIDLHHTLPAEVSAEAVVWPTLWSRAVRLRVDDRRVAVLDEPSRALLVVLHALHHGPGARQPRLDLERAIDRLEDGVWAEAARVAEAIMALSQFAAGLRVTPAGAAIATRIGLPDPEVLERLGRAGVAAGIERLVSAPGARERLALLWRELVPPREFMHWWRPWSRRSRRALVAAYGFRLGWLLCNLGPGLRAWRHARAETRTR